MNKCFGSQPLLQRNPESKFLAENTALKKPKPVTPLSVFYPTQQVCNSHWVLEGLG